MVNSWVTIIMLAFGILVAVIGVFAYLRMFYKEKSLSSSPTAIDIPPPITARVVPPEDKASADDLKQ
ncbi:hypothetical protein [Paenibacillus sp. NPDC058174]|uniref:hypothetical protein n=1 Tax=Paenibacillus sp. NPDC058174 TaxID=3346366 RepID=UPI0036DC0A5F